MLVGAQRKLWNFDEVGHIQCFCPKPRSQHNAEEKCDNSISERMFTVSADLPEWLVDSGESGHMTHQKKLFLDYHGIATLEKVGVGIVQVVEGNVRLKMLFKVNRNRLQCTMFCTYRNWHASYFQCNVINLCSVSVLINISQRWSMSVYVCCLSMNGMVLALAVAHFQAPLQIYSTLGLRSLLHPLLQLQFKTCLDQNHFHITSLL